MAYQINNIEELEEFFINNNIKTSDDLGNKGLDYWNNTLKPLINPVLFKKPKNKEELYDLIEEEYPLLLIDTVNVETFFYLFDNLLHKIKNEKYWENPLNYIGLWNTKNVIDMSYCFSLHKYFNQRLYWDTKNVKDISYMFSGCENYNQPVNFDLSNCENTNYIFYGCICWNKPVILINTSNIKTAMSMFRNCRYLNQKIELSLPNCQDVSYMFYNCENLNSPIILKNTYNIKDISGSFFNCKNLDIKNINKELLLILIKELGKNFVGKLKEWKIKYDKEYIDKLYSKTNVKLISEI